MKCTKAHVQETIQYIADSPSRLVNPALSRAGWVRLGPSAAGIA